MANPALSSDGSGAYQRVADVNAPVARLARLCASFSAPMRHLFDELSARRASLYQTASRLTASGAPFEAAFVWPGGNLRISLDPCPEASAQVRTASCLAGMRTPLTPEQNMVCAQLMDWQAQHACRFGAWLGVRGGLGASAQGDALSTKLYLEVPAGAEWGIWEQNLLDSKAVLPSRNIRLSMVGLDPMRGGVELYYRSASLFPGELNTLLKRFRLSPRGSEITAWIQQLLQRSIRDTLPSADMGFSCATSASGAPQIFTWYSTSIALLGPPERARAALLRVGEADLSALQAYAQFSAPAPGERVPEHGLIGAMLAENVPMQTTATVSGVWEANNVAHDQYLGEHDMSSKSARAAERNHV